MRIVWFWLWLMLVFVGLVGIILYTVSEFSFCGIVSATTVVLTDVTQVAVMVAGGWRLWLFWQNWQCVEKTFSGNV